MTTEQTRRMIQILNRNAIENVLPKAGQEALVICQRLVRVDGKRKKLRRKRKSLGELDNAK
jgi:hypothetical protein